MSDGIHVWSALFKYVDKLTSWIVAVIQTLLMISNAPFALHGDREVLLEIRT